MKVNFFVSLCLEELKVFVRERVNTNTLQYISIENLEKDHILYESDA